MNMMRMMMRMNDIGDDGTIRSISGYYGRTCANSGPINMTMMMMMMMMMMSRWRRRTKMEMCMIDDE
jgi:hypothetical protein